MSNSAGFSGFIDAAGERWGGFRLWLNHQWHQAFDADQWASGETFRDKLSAISLPHAGAGLALVGLLLVGGFYLFAPHHPGPPPLPSEVARESIRSATRAYEGELSPALAAANAPVEGPAQ